MGVLGGADNAVAVDGWGVVVVGGRGGMGLGVRMGEEIDRRSGHAGAGFRVDILSLLNSPSLAYDSNWGELGGRGNFTKQRVRMCWLGARFALMDLRGTSLALSVMSRS